MNIFSNIGITELIVILLLALLVVGPERLPEMGRTLAKTLRDLRKAYENLTKDLGPELMSIQETTKELRESVESITSIPQDVVSSVVKAADLDDTIEDLKQDLDSLQQVGRTMSDAGKMIKNPVGAAMDTARDALLPKSDQPGEVAEEPGEQESPAADDAPAAVPSVQAADQVVVDQEPREEEATVEEVRDEQEERSDE